MYLENIFLAVSNIQFSIGKIGNNFTKTVFRKDQLTIDSSMEPINLWFPKIIIVFKSSTKQVQDTKYLHLNINSKHQITSQNDIIL